MPHAIRINDLAAQGPIGRTKLFDLVKRGLLPARKVDGVTFVLTRDWFAFLEGAPIITRQDDSHAA